MKKTIKRYMGKGMKIWMILLVIGIAFSETMILSSCSSENPYFTASEDDDPRILNTDLSSQKLDRKTHLNMQIKVTPVHFTTVTWFLDDTQIAEGNTIDQTLPVGEHKLKIVATTTRGKSTSRTLSVSVTPMADDPVLGTNATELWVAPGEVTTIHDCKNLQAVSQVLVGGENVAFEVQDEGTSLKLTAPENLENGDYDLTFVVDDSVEIPGGSIKVTTEEKPSLETTLWEGEFALTWSTPFKELQYTLLPKVQVGTILRVYVDGNGQGMATTSWWNNILTGKSDPERGDIIVNGPAIWEFVLTDLSIELLTKQKGLYIVGNGCTVKKVTIE